MSIEVMSQVWKLELEPAHRIVLLALADHAHDDGTHVFPSIEYTAWKTGYSEAQTRRIIKALVKSEILSSTPRPGKTNVYAIHIEKGKRKSSFNPLQDDTPTPVIAMTPESSVESLVKDSAPKNGAGGENGKTESSPSKRKPDPWYDAIKSIWRYEGQMNGAMRKMLQGKATAPSWKDGNVSVTLTPPDVLTWAAWYRATELGGNEKLNMLEERMKIASSIQNWHNLGRPTACGSLLDTIRLVS